MSELRPLPIWQDNVLSMEDVERIKAAKRALELPYMVQLAHAASEGESRVLAIGTPPPFACDYFLIESTLDSNLQDAVAWTLGEAEDDFRIVTMVEMLSEWLGDEVTEVTDAKHGGLGRDDKPRLPEHERECQHYGTTVECGVRGCFDPNANLRDAERALREADRTAARGEAELQG